MKLQAGLVTFGSLRPSQGQSQGMAVAKINRFNKATYGVVSTSRAFLKCGGIEGLVYVVPHKPEDPPFGLNGDSGSWVIDKYGNASGMFVGIETGKYPGSCYLTDMAEIKVNIEKVTGKKVVMAHS